MMTKSWVKKKILKEEPLGNSPAIKVIYDDGSYGLRMNPTGNGEQSQEALSNMQQRVIQNKINQLLQDDRGAALAKGAGLIHSNSNISESALQSLQDMSDRASFDIDSNDPELAESFGKYMKNYIGTPDEENAYKSFIINEDGYYHRPRNRK